MIREYSFCSLEFIEVFFVSQGIVIEKMVFSLLSGFRFLHRFIRPTLLCVSFSFILTVYLICAGYERCS